jgi:outer membrane receptor protein involved in Fe transport
MQVLQAGEHKFIFLELDAETITIVAKQAGFDIKIKDTITSLSSNTAIANCAVNNDPLSCSRIHRGAGGSLWFNTAEFVAVPYQNIGQVETKGIDLEGNYHLMAGVCPWWDSVTKR